MAGYNINSFVNPELIKERHKCCTCQQVVRWPVQSISCGHMFCLTCLISRNTSQCPVEGRITDCFEDKACCHEISKLSTYCTYRSNGCPWRGCLKRRQVHTRSCLYQFPNYHVWNTLVECPICDQHVKAHLIQAHMLNNCPQIARLKKGAGIDSSGLKCTYKTARKVFSMFGASPVNQNKLRDPYYGSCYLPAYGKYDHQLCFENEWEDISSIEHLNKRIVDLVHSMMKTHNEVTRNVIESLLSHLDVSTFDDVVSHPYVCSNPADLKSSLSKTRHSDISMILQQCRNHININNWCDVNCLHQLLKLSTKYILNPPVLFERERKQLHQFDTKLSSCVTHCLYLLGTRNMLLSMPGKASAAKSQRLSDDSLSQLEYTSSCVEYNIPVTRCCSAKKEEDAVFIPGDSILDVDKFWNTVKRVLSPIK